MTYFYETGRKWQDIYFGLSVDLGAFIIETTAKRSERAIITGWTKFLLNLTDLLFSTKQRESKYTGFIPLF